MSYPEKGATYRHEPKFLDRMKDEERKSSTPYRANGGEVEFDADETAPERYAEDVGEIR